MRQLKFNKFNKFQDFGDLRKCSDGVEIKVMFNGSVIIVLRMAADNVTVTDVVNAINLKEVTVLCPEKKKL